MNLNKKILLAVLTFNRPNDLSVTLNKIVKSEIISRILVIQNPGGENIDKLLKEFHSKDSRINHIKLVQNMGSAGGQNAAIIYCISNNFDAVILMDDDCYPDDNAIDLLIKKWLSLKENDNTVLGPLVVDPTVNKLSFGLWKTTKNLTKPKDLIWTIDEAKTKSDKDGLYWHWTNFFLGVLVPSKLIKNVGAPIPEMFIRGEEVEYFYRILRLGFYVATYTGVKFFHPSDTPNSNEIKDYFQTRNSSWNNKKYFPTFKSSFVFYLSLFWNKYKSNLVYQALRRSKDNNWFIPIRFKNDLPHLIDNGV